MLRQRQGQLKRVLLWSMSDHVGDSSLASKYLRYFPKPLLDDLVTGGWLPIVGAGMSLNAKVPMGKSVPLWSQLGTLLEKDLDDFASSGPIDAISAFEQAFGRSRLIERISELLLLRDALPGEAHRQFCSIPFDLVCTTNFDFLLERQYDLTPRYVYPVVDEEQLSLNVVRDGTLLLKLHGDVRHPSRLVVTESDYDAFLNRYPLIATYLANLLITKTAVLIGYSLDDPDFRQVWQIVAQRLGRTRRQAYAISVGAKPSDVARFARRGVTVIFLHPNRWRYDILRALDYFRASAILAGADPDPRLGEAVDNVRSRRLEDGTWPLDWSPTGRVWFEVDDGQGKPSQWLTLRAMRVLRWWES